MPFRTFWILCDFWIFLSILTSINIIVFHVLQLIVSQLLRLHTLLFPAMLFVFSLLFYQDDPPYYFSFFICFLLDCLLAYLGFILLVHLTS